MPITVERQPRPSVRTFGSEKRIENPVYDLRRDPGAGIAHPHNNSCPVSAPEIALAYRCVHFFFAALSSVSVPHAASASRALTHRFQQHLMQLRASPSTIGSFRSHLPSTGMFFGNCP